MSGLWGSPWRVHRADPTDLRAALPTVVPRDRERAIVLTRINLRPGNNTDLLEMLGLMEQENTNV